MARNDDEPDVKVHLSAGCVLDGKTDPHTHPQAEWRDLIDNYGDKEK